MSLTQARLTINSRAAIMASILEQSGHLSEYLQDSVSDFGDCCKYILYSFYENTNDVLVEGITKSSMKHMENLTNNGQPCITDSGWIRNMNKDHILREITCVKSVWSSWTPEHDVASLMKTSFDSSF